MKIVIFSGGTGSVGLQRGLYKVFGPDCLDYSVIINCYDNGKSTGTCRQVFDGKILGPSDLRKNQLLRHELSHGNNKLLEFLEQRLTFSYSDIEDAITDQLVDLLDKNDEHELDLYSICMEGTQLFFNSENATNVEYKDFSVANIIYSGLASKYGMNGAAKQMSRVLGIYPDDVICNDDTSLFLQAKTKSGHIISDEGDLVEWNNAEDKITECFLLDVDGNQATPILTTECKDLIDNADVLIFSSGTQWSSLIPTYMSIGFTEAISKSKAKKYVVLNTSQDKDIKGLSGLELLDLITTHLKVDTKTLIPVISSNASDDILITPDQVEQVKQKFADVVYSEMSEGNKHNPNKLVLSIFGNYFGIKTILDRNNLVFDLDDTVIARNLNFEWISRENCAMFDFINRSNKLSLFICTGNDVSKLKGHFETSINTFADGGVNEYLVSKENITFIKHLDNDMLIEKSTMETLIELLDVHGIPKRMIQNRNNSILSIRPILPEYRYSIFNLIFYILIINNLNDRIEVKMTGNSTVELSTISLSKTVIMNTIFKDKEISYVGDEPIGNDKDMFSNPKIHGIKVKGAFDTNMLLKILCIHSLS